MADLIHHPDECKLGKKDPSPPRQMIHEYVDIEQAAPQVPVNVINSAGQSTPLAMYLNDKEGDCTCAGAGNLLRVNSAGTQQIADGDVQTAYVAVTGKEGGAYDPATGSNDNGCVELDVLDYWATTGIGGDVILGHAGVDMTNDDEVRVMCYLFGAIYPGWALKQAQQTQAIWDYAAGSPDWGGHCAPTFDVYGSAPSGLVIGGASIPAGSQIEVQGTWGNYKASTPAFRKNQGDEGHVVITKAWVTANQGNPLMNLQALLADFKQLAPEA